MVLRRASDTPPSDTIVRRQYPRDAAGLAAQLRDDDPSVRRWAVRDLVRDGPQTDAGVVALLGERLVAEPDPGVRSALLTGLAAVGTAGAVDALLPQLRSDDAALRNGAIEALAAMPEAVAPRITALLDDADSDVRIFTVNLLADLRHDDVPRWLVEVLRDDAEVNVVAAAIDALAEVGRPIDVPALRAAGARFPGNDYVAFAVDLAVDRIEST